MSDQVTHTPTPWTVSYGSSGWGMGCVHSIVPAVDRDTIIAEVQSVTSYCIGASAADKNLASTQRANAEFIVLAVNSHHALAARVAELEAENEKLRAHLLGYATDNLWDAYCDGDERDETWTDGGVSGAEWLRRELGFEPGIHDAEMIKDRIPELAAKLVERAALTKPEA